MSRPSFGDGTTYEMNSNTLYLLRHAHADYLPDESRPLSFRGIEDSIGVADILSQYPIEAIYTSPARRAYQTVEPLAERLGLTLIVEPDLQEWRLGRGPFEDFFNDFAFWKSLTMPDI